MLSLFILIVLVAIAYLLWSYTKELRGTADVTERLREAQIQKEVQKIEKIIKETIKDSYKQEKN